jgi:hypothetical protein
LDQGWPNAGGVVVSDWDAGVRTRLASVFSGIRPVRNDNLQAAGQDIVFLAVEFALQRIDSRRLKLTSWRQRW